MVLPLLAAGWAADELFNDGDATAGVGGFFEKQMNDFNNVGKNKYQNQNYTPGEVNYGGQYGADGIAQMGFDRMGYSNGAQGWQNRESQRNRGPQAFENQELSDREAASRYGDQDGSIMLAREAAMGQAPSVAAYQMQAGLDRAMAQQSAMAGGARGAGGIAMAGANAAASGAAMQNQAYQGAGMLRAQEMADGRALYGNLAGQQRGQDQNRLQMGNQMSQYNAGANDNYRLGMGGLANQTGQTGQGWYQAAQNPYNQQGQMDMGREQIAADSFNQGQARVAGVSQANADARAAQEAKKWGLLGTGMDVAGKGIAAGGSGGKA